VENNWGRWGNKDERGTLNLMTPATVLAAVGTVRTGEVFSLGGEISREGTLLYPGRSPVNHFMGVDGGDWASKPNGDNESRVEYADDYLATHTHNGTHIDALAHVWAGGRLYNGFSRNTVRSSGAKVCDIEKIRGIVARGVLLDLAAHAGIEHLSDGHIITPEELDDCARAQGVSLLPGDALLFRTGWQRVGRSDPERFHRSQPGIGVAAARHLAKQDLCLIGADNMGVERMPYGEPGVEALMPCHVILLRDYGIHLLEMLELDDLATRQRYEFLFTVAPLRIKGGVGSPINPLAVL